MPFQINSKKLFLTYSDEELLTKQDVFDQLHELLEVFGIEEMLVAEELHQNGVPHFHAYIALKETLRTRSKSFADLVRPDGTNKHGNYQGCRSAKNVLKYCTKEDNFVATFDVGQLLGNGKSRAKIFGERIIQGEDFLEIMQDFPENIKGYTRLRQDVQEFLKDMEDRRNPCALPDEIPNPWGQRFFVETDNKKCHFWFYSHEPNKGKTTGVICPLVRDHSACLFNPKSTYHEIRKTTTVICLDEFSKGQMKAQQLNTLCDGFFKFRIFMGGEIMLNSKPIVIICSNFSIDEVFPYMNELVHARFYEIDVSNFDLV